MPCSAVNTTTSNRGGATCSRKWSTPGRFLNLHPVLYCINTQMLHICLWHWHLIASYTYCVWTSSLSLLFCHEIQRNGCCQVWFQASAMVQMRFFWDFTQCRLEICYQHMRTIYWSYLQGSSSQRRRDRQVVPKHQLQTRNLCSVKSQKNADLVLLSLLSYLHYD